MRNRSRRVANLLTGMFAALAVQAVLAQSVESGAGAAPANAAPRPRVGLVLAGGGAKGAAHVGVLKVLEEMHVPIDCIAGTSMGALVGGGYASGIPAQQMQDFLLGINWQVAVGGVGQRDLMPIEQKRQGVTYSNRLELGLQDKRVVMAPGLVNTSGIEDLLRGFVAKARAQSNFDSLPIPYRAVATDMVTGNMVVFDHGDIAIAMRASMAIPGAFAPVFSGEQILADGGLVRNIPVDVARHLCADVVIVVNLVEPPVDPAKLHSPAALLGRTMDVMIEANEDLQLKSLTAKDVRIDVEMGDIGTADFERVGEAIPLGEAAARRVAPQLARFAVSPKEYLAWRKKATSDQGIETQIAEVQFAGLKRVSPEYLKQRAGIRAGDNVTSEKIGQEAQRMSALQDIESVGYELKGDPASPTLEWLPREKSWGPDFLKVDLGLYASVEGDSGFILDLQHTRTWVNSLGAEWRNQGELGYDERLATSFYQPLEVSQRFFVEPKLSWNRSWQDFYNDNERVARYRFADLTGAIDLGLNLGGSSQLRVGYLAQRRKVTVDTGPQQLPTGDFTDAGILLSAIYDTRDTPFNPTRGVAGALDYTVSDGQLGGDRNWQRAELGLGLAVPFRRDVLWIAAAGGTALGTPLPADRLFALGGPGSFPGHEIGELRAADYWTVSTSYLRKLTSIASLRGEALYAGLRLQGGEVFDLLSGQNEKSIASLSLYVAGRTPVGPLTLGYAATNTDSWSLWLSVGRPIGGSTMLERGIFR